MSAARAQGLAAQYLPVVSGRIEATDIATFRDALEALPGPVLAYCASGTRSASLWALSQAGRMAPEAIFDAAEKAGYDLVGLRSRISFTPHNDNHPGLSRSDYQIVILGGGAAGLATAASLRARQSGLDIAIIEPSPDHYYQPGFTLVGGGVFRPQKVIAQTERLIPDGVKWIRASVSGFDPEANTLLLEDGEQIRYEVLIVAAGLKIELDAIPGLKETLGQNGVTTNYLIDHAPYTRELATTLKAGRAIFTQPRGPFKCAGAPQKAMYLTCDTWRKRGVLKNIEVSFHTPGEALFGIKAYIPALEAAVARYQIKPRFQEDLVAVDGPRQIAVFEMPSIGEGVQRIERAFDMLHVVPPQGAMDFIADSPLADSQGWVDVDHETLQHRRYENVFAVGDCAGAPNAKTAAAARKQAPVVAGNVLRVLRHEPLAYAYNGYGSCPLIVSRGKALLAEFSYGGELDPSFPNWLVDGRKPSRLAWWLKTRFMRSIYYHLMLKGREWLAKPKPLRRAKTVGHDPLLSERNAA
jgi:sulfide:quinone oxidoreductase